MIEAVIYGIVSAAVYSMVTIIAYVFNQRRLRKEALSDLIQEIENLAALYLCSGESSDNCHRGINIQQKLHILKQKIDTSKQQVQDSYVEYWRVVTGDSFGGPTDETIDSSSPDKNPKVLLIREKSKNLRKALKI